MNKIAQISVFIVMSVILVVIAIVFFTNSNNEKIEFLREEKINSYVNYDKEFNNIRDNIQSCFDNSLKDGIYYLSVQGGYYNYDGVAVEYYDLDIPYYFNDNVLKIPQISTIEKELQDYINYETFYCIENQQYELDGHGFNLEYDEINSTVKIMNNTLFLEVDFPLAVSYVDKISYYKYFNLKYNYDFISKYTVVENYVKEHKSKNYSGIPLGYLTSYAYENKFRYDYYAYDNNTVVYMFTFDSAEEEPLVYSFAIEYDWGEVE